jgi:hypothetical protein
VVAHPNLHNFPLWEDLEVSRVGWVEMIGGALGVTRGREDGSLVFAQGFQL